MWISVLLKDAGRGTGVSTDAFPWGHCLKGKPVFLTIAYNETHHPFDEKLTITIRKPSQKCYKIKGHTSAFFPCCYNT